MPRDTSAGAALSARRLRPRKYRVERCSGICSLGERMLGPQMAERVHSWFEEGVGNDVIISRAVEFGVKLSNGAVGRHRKNHLVPETAFTDLAEVEPDEKPLGDIELLEKMIQVGARQLNSKSVRVSPEMTMRAMELKYKLTQGNAFQGFLDAVNAAFSEDEGEPDNPDAAQSADEQAQASPEDPA